jgi:ketosteroid isomerase-like protein
VTEEEKVELVRTMYAAWSRRDLPALLEYIHPDYELVQAEENVGATTYRGPEGIQELARQFAETWDGFEMTPTGFKLAGNRLAVRLHQQARGRGSGIVVESNASHLVEFRESRVVRMVAYSDPADAFRALESSP